MSPTVRLKARRKTRKKGSEETNRANPAKGLGDEANEDESDSPRRDADAEESTEQARDVPKERIGKKGDLPGMDAIRAIARALRKGHGVGAEGVGRGKPVSLTNLGRPRERRRVFAAPDVGEGVGV